MTKPKPLNPRGKQHDARASSFKRIAKALRVRAKNSVKVRSDSALVYSDMFRAIAAELDHEAELLRDMR